MGDTIRFMRDPVRATATSVQSYDDALDVLGYRALDLYLVTYGLTGADPEATVTIETSMLNSSDTGWHTIVTFAVMDAASAKTDVQSVQAEVLRYVRWRVTFGGGVGDTTSFVFEILGIGRPG